MLGFQALIPIIGFIYSIIVYFLPDLKGNFFPFCSFEDAHNLFDVFFTVSIYGIWFYDKEECQRIAELMKK